MVVASVWYKVNINGYTFSNIYLFLTVPIIGKTYNSKVQIKTYASYQEMS